MERQTSSNEHFLVRQVSFYQITISNINIPSTLQFGSFSRNRNTILLVNASGMDLYPATKYTIGVICYAMYLEILRL